MDAETIGAEPDKGEAKKRRLWIPILIALGSLVLLAGVAFVFWPNFFIDSAIGFLFESYHLRVDGRVYLVDFETLEEGVTREDRVFIVRKIVTMRLIGRRNKFVRQPTRDYLRLLVRAAEDNVLTLQEVRNLRALHADYVPSRKVGNILGILMSRLIDQF